MADHKMDVTVNSMAGPHGLSYGDHKADAGHGEGASRRDFIFIAASAFGAVGAGTLVWPLIDQMNPAQDSRALATAEFDLSTVELGQEVRFTWRGKPVFVRHRTPEEIEAAQKVELTSLKDKLARNDGLAANLDASDKNRVPLGPDGQPKPEYIVLVGICTHLGCVPLFGQGDFGGWFCPCHGSHYDTAGRIRLGPAPANLEVPKVAFLSDSVVRIG